ncbi:MAG: dihydroneopterin aldolase [Bowdeniella nasicola]|nr:dihydroneopterin aldolase [Bowdeniella nasicola]
MAEAEITITGICAHGYHGVRDFEARDGQSFLVDLTYWLDSTAAVSADELEYTVSYSEIATQVARIIQGEFGRFDLIETLAETIARQVLSHQAITRTRVRVHKPEAPLRVDFDDVTITIERTRLSLPARAPRKVALSLGANLGPDPAGQVRWALQELQAVLGPLVTSELEVTTAQLAPGQARQPDYVNALAIANTTLAADDILRLAHRIENTAGRIRDQRWQARVLDIDVIAIAGLTSTAPHLLLPHPRAHERRFVLQPLAQLWPDVDIAGHRPAWWLQRLAAPSS